MIIAMHLLGEAAENVAAEVAGSRQRAPSKALGDSDQDRESINNPVKLQNRSKELENNLM